MATALQEIRQAQRADGHAAVLAIGTANPATSMLQDEYTDYYFRVTKSEHLTHLKHKLKRILRTPGIEKRFMHVSEEILDAHPDLIDRTLPTLDARIDMASAAVPKLAASAAWKAIVEWGRPATDITHLVFSTYSGGRAPSADLRLASLLGLRPTVCRTVLNLNGCSGGGRALQIAKELAENNRGARDGCLDTIVGQGLFGDGAGAIVVGADPVEDERPLFEMAFTTQTTIPETEDAITMQLRKGGLDFHISSQVPRLLAENIERVLIDAFEPLGVVANGAAWNDLFWAIHPGGRSILDNIEELLGLDAEKLGASRQVLRDFGNMSGATVIFVLDELRRRRAKEGETAAEWGVVMAFGPGITIETMVLHAATNNLKEN
ncbi:bisdemethoxycurcumin synthase-like [Triticum aestivum]|uniref:bisdemethoxycurcumin synthase-like n=1 Tax=Triticum aestivum TaxID=4565 RepID=UPI001D0106F4|nr:bisdemethoxycurcumin synthase-like [Triticum aestivum]